MKKILVAIDFSPASDRALGQALKLGAAFGSHLLLVHVLHDPTEAPGFYSSPKAGKKVFRNMEHAATAMMEEYVTKRVKGYEALETRIVPGLPAEEIVRQAAAAKVDLVVMGTRSRGGLKRLMLGSVADGVVRACECPVLVVPEGPKARKRG